LNPFKKTLSEFGGRGCLLIEMPEKSAAELLREYADRGNEDTSPRSGNGN